ncbi:putative transcriptional regulatory protein [Enhygromyxa salina]|uniref:Probable transcriptional regulatory protein ENSA5_36520 n=1 Tax=Enhygromyxa salina TaxID=215803 RepID=A0A2S9XUN0_9BACT|nr:YebC/PmpR family DNA-binding transcriptional regulator [Enhygromyxa salina]PRP96576.1 putative transcriptional regulatory protein [Enhygromyxa salina]
MGRTFENRKLAMMKRGDRDAKAFTRAGRQISMAVKSGGADPDGNPGLRRAIQNARAVNMPKDKIQGAIDKAAGLGDVDGYETVFYEGYGPHGIAMMVETATDNPTRTVANLRFAFKKGSGNLGNSGSVAFMFDQLGVFRLDPEGLDRDELELELIDHGLEQLDDGINDDGDPVLILRCAREDFGNLQSGLEAKKIAVASSGFEWVPKTTTELSDEDTDEVLELIDRLEQDDDVQVVFHNLG